MRLKPAALQSLDMHITTEPLCSQQFRMRMCKCIHTSKHLLYLYAKTAVFPLYIKHAEVSEHGQEIPQSHNAD